MKVSPYCSQIVTALGERTYPDSIDGIPVLTLTSLCQKTKCPNGEDESVWNDFLVFLCADDSIREVESELVRLGKSHSRLLQEGKNRFRSRSISGTFGVCINNFLYSILPPVASDLGVVRKWSGASPKMGWNFALTVDARVGSECVTVWVRKDRWSTSTYGQGCEAPCVLLAFIHSFIKAVNVF